MLAVRHRYTIYLIVICAILTALLFTFGNRLFADVYSVKGIALSIAIFTAIEIFIVWFMEVKSEKLTQPQMINFLMGTKVVKILIALLLIAIYAFTVKTRQTSFYVVFLGTYLVFLLFNTFYLTSREKRLKTKQRL